MARILLYKNFVNNHRLKNLLYRGHKYIKLLAIYIVVARLRVIKSELRVIKSES